jgi:hypothetical protein
MLVLLCLFVFPSQLCFRYFANMRGANSCKKGPSCRFSHRLEDLRKLRRANGLGEEEDAPPPAEVMASLSLPPGCSPWECSAQLAAGSKALFFNPGATSIKDAFVDVQGARTRERSLLQRRLLWTRPGTDGSPSGSSVDPVALQADLFAAAAELVAQSDLAMSDIQWMGRVQQPDDQAANGAHVLMIQLREHVKPSSVSSACERVGSQLRPFLHEPVEEINRWGSSRMHGRSVKLCPRHFVWHHGGCLCNLTHDDAEAVRLLRRAEWLATQRAIEAAQSKDDELNAAAAAPAAVSNGANATAAEEADQAMPPPPPLDGAEEASAAAAVKEEPSALKTEPME